MPCLKIVQSWRQFMRPTAHIPLRTIRWAKNISIRQGVEAVCGDLARGLIRPSRHARGGFDFAPARARRRCRSAFRVTGKAGKNA